MIQRIRFRQIDVPWDDVHSDEAEIGGLAVPQTPWSREDHGGRWIPFQVEIRSTPREARPPNSMLIRLAVWERFEPGEDQ